MTLNVELQAGLDRKSFTLVLQVPCPVQNFMVYKAQTSLYTGSTGRTSFKKHTGTMFFCRGCQINLVHCECFKSPDVKAVVCLPVNYT